MCLPWPGSNPKTAKLDCASLPFRLRARRPVVPALREPAAAARAAAARSRRGLVRVGQRPTSKRARGLCALTLMVDSPETPRLVARSCELPAPRPPRRKTSNRRATSPAVLLRVPLLSPETSAPLVRALLRPRAPRRRRRSPVTQLVLRRLRHLVDLAGQMLRTIAPSMALLILARVNANDRCMEGR